MSDLPRAADVGGIINRVIDHAENELPAPITVDIQLWDDGDCSIRAFHTNPILNGNIDDKTEVRYNAEKDRIELRDYRYHKLDQELLEQSLEVLEEGAE